MTRYEMLERLAEHRSSLDEVERFIKYDIEESDRNINKPEVSEIFQILFLASKAADVASRLFMQALSFADQQHRSQDGKTENPK